MEHTHTTSGTARLATSQIGSGAAVVFLHAGVADRRSWYHAMGAVASRHRAVAYDRRGFGDTEYAAEPHSHLDDLWAVYDAVGARDAVLVGNSQGGRIAIDAALAHPERVRGLVLVAPAVSGAPEPTAVPLDEATLDAAFERAGDDLDAVNDVEAKVWLDGPAAEPGRVGGTVRTLFLDMNGRALRAAEVGPEREPTSAWERLGAITVPTRVTVGSLDLSHVRARAEHIAATVANGSLVVFDGVAHLPQLERPDAFAAELQAFLA